MPCKSKGAFEEYLKRVRETYLQGDSTEMSYRTFLQNYIESLSHGYKLTEESTKPENVEGKPDYKARRDGVHVGYIETKDMPVDLDAALETKQLKRYMSGIDNLVLTNYSRFILIRNGESILNAQIFDPETLTDRKVALSEENISTLEKLVDDFFDYKLPVIKSAEVLARELAKKCRMLKDLAKDQLDEDIKNERFGESTSSVIEFYQLIRGLLPDIGPDDCADAYAQTIAYGMFLGRYYQVTSSSENSKSVAPLTRSNAAELVPQSIGLIRKILHEADFMLPENLQWVVDEICHVLNVTDIASTLQDITERTGHRAEKERDAFLLFYEDFLAQYDPAKRKSRGVYYTPRQVVSFIVKSVEEILKTYFHKVEGFADESVTVLDPATGTGTFLNLVYLRTLLQLKNSGRGGLIDGKIHSHVLKHFFGFELLIPPYILAHLKLNRQLISWHAKLGTDERVQVFLTNSLEAPTSQAPKTLDAFMREISHEGAAANDIKKKPILVILGNPPYSGVSANNYERINSTLREGHVRGDGTKDCGYYSVDGKPLAENNPKWLLDDYVKFIRFAQRKIDVSGEGVLAFITNHSYLDNPTFRGMRESLLSSFDKVFILNLHGNALKKERAPDGTKDENVFDIKQGVAITIMVRNRSHRELRVFYADLFGLRDLKYSWLDHNTVLSASWQEIRPVKPFYFLVPKNLSAEYESFWKVTDIFPEYSVGIATARDDLTIKWTPEEVWRTVIDFSSMDAEAARTAFHLGQDVRDWKVKLAQEDLVSSGPDKSKIVPVLYRPFDVRYTYYTGRSRGFHCMPRPEIMGQMLRRQPENLGLVTSRLTKGEKFAHVMITRNILEVISLSPKTSNNAFVFPLYLHRKDEKELWQSVYNISEKLLQELSAAYKVAVQPELVMYYVYATLHSAEYRSRYEENLQIDFPRIPFAKALQAFEELAEIGKELVELHLSEGAKLQTHTEFRVSGTNKVEATNYDNDAIRINTSQSFEGVPMSVWNYHVGGYRVLEKWLKSRKGRVLSQKEIEWFMQLVEILKSSIELAKRIDKVDFMPPKSGSP